MNRNIKLLGLFNFFTDFHLYSAILIIYFARVTGSYVSAMSLYSVAMISSAIFEIPTGIFSDYIGRKKTMILGALCSILSVIFYAIGLNYFILFIGAFFEGISRSWYSGNNDALLHDSLSSIGKKESYDHFMGKTHAMFQVAAAAGIIIGGFIAVWSFPVVMWLSVIPQVICLIICFLIKEPKNISKTSSNIYVHLKSTIKIIASNKKLKLLSLNNAITYAIGESSYQFRAAFVNALWPLWAVGFSKIFSSIGAAISYWYAGKVIKKYGEFKLLFISSLYGKFINIFSVVFATVFSPILLSSTSLTYGITQVAKSKIMQKEFSDEQRATLGSFNSFIGSIFFSIFAIILGLLADVFGVVNGLLIAYICLVPTAWIYWILFRDYKEE